jgi:SAM-dependent methyltransferase
MSDRKSDDRRFRFGDNWLDFARDLSADQIVEAEKSLRDLLGRDGLAGMRFIDVGSGSGLFSLAARRLGARVHSFDYDMDSVLCTRRLRDRHFPSDHDWTIEQGSVLDPDYIRTLGTFDIVYSWGVLHHTGNMQPRLLPRRRWSVPAACSPSRSITARTCAAFGGWRNAGMPAPRRRRRAASAPFTSLSCDGVSP